MVTFIRFFGNHTNQIWEFVTSDALAKELNLNFRFLFIKNFFRYYPNISKKYKNFSTLFIYPCLVFIFRLLRKLKFIKFLSLKELSTCELLASNQSHNQYILPFWDYGVNKTLYNNKDLLLKYHDYYKDLFSTEISDAKEKYISKTKTNVAIHVRRGDYAQYAGGKFYFSDDVFIKKVKELCRLFKLKDIRLLICTNDPELNLSKYQTHFTDVLISKEDFTTDHQLMAECDFIIGPSSSFSMWASYLGQTPCMHIYDPDETMKKEDFCIYNSWPSYPFCKDQTPRHNKLLDYI